MAGKEIFLNIKITSAQKVRRQIPVIRRDSKLNDLKFASLHTFLYHRTELDLVVLLNGSSYFLITLLQIVAVILDVFILSGVRLAFCMY